MNKLTVILLFGATNLLAQNPVLHRVSPLGVPAGASTELKLLGDRLQDITSAWMSLSEAEVGVSSNSTVVIRTPKDAAGIAGFRIATSSGTSELVMFMADALPSATACTNNSRESAHAVGLPIAVDSCTGELKFDYYRFAARKDETVSIEVVASRIGSKLDPVLRILDASGREVGFCEDAPSAGRDCRIQFRPPTTGEYLAEVRDIAYGGGPQYYYRIRFGRFTFPTCTYPLSAKRGDTVQILGVQGERFSPASVEVDDTPAFETIGKSFVALNRCAMGLVFEQEPNDSRERANAVSIPATVNGRFEKNIDVDWFQIDVEKDQRWIFSSASRSLGSPCDVFMTLHDAAGKELAAANVSGASDASLTNTFKSAGRVYLKLKELTDRGAPDFAYHIAVEKFEPGFSLFADDDKIEAKSGGEANLSISCLRYEFTDKIDITFEGLPDGCSFENAVIETKKTNATVKIKVPESVAPGTLSTFKVIGRAGERRSVASTLPVLRRNFPLMLYPPASLDGVVTLGITAEAPAPEPRRRRR